MPTNYVARDGNRSALFVGAHPDDIEIACGGTLAKLNDLGWTTWICVLTDENDAEVAQLRRKETVSSAAVCGVDPQHVLFLGASDASLDCNGSTVATLRRLTLEHDCNPDLIFTHSRADSHNDHRVAHDLVLSSFRKKVILCFAVVNSLIESHFKPSVFIDISKYNDVKLLALALHHTQQHRIDLASIAQFSTAFQHQSESSACEPFEMVVQYGADAATQVATSLSNSVFNTFWSRLAKTQPVVNLYSPITSHRNAQDAQAHGAERQGFDLLIDAFAQRWSGRFPLTEIPANKPDATLALASSTCLLAGGAATNMLTAQIFNQLDSVRFITAGNDSAQVASAILDRCSGKILTAQMRENDSSQEILVDYGVLTVMRNPCNADKFLIGCMGIHAFGSLGCFHALADPRLLRYLPQNNFQILVRIDVATSRTDLMTETLYFM